MITVKLNENNKELSVKPFPKLMKNESNEIVYFVSHGVGLPISGRGWNFECLEPAGWVMEYYTDYNEPITIQNA